MPSTAPRQTADISGAYDAISEFVDWLDANGYVIGEYGDEPVAGWPSIHKADSPPDVLIAASLGVDLGELQQEHGSGADQARAGQ